ncbi:hypothetical protein DM02DRAFT_403142 [Periconia macrospinosa]|uniref:Uncharacterized protein n=1 Tax=Periconia macrospinosa TaxID=97972 RepID=A0A2V1E7X6_9PLEO|nr:hypothetical protein DM02DRAFT_403142 [Periconia macrospinosa]
MLIFFSFSTLRKGKFIKLIFLIFFFLERLKYKCLSKSLVLPFTTPTFSLSTSFPMRSFIPCAMAMWLANEGIYKSIVMQIVFPPLPSPRLLLLLRFLFFSCNRCNQTKMLHFIPPSSSSFFFSVIVSMSHVSLPPAIPFAKIPHREQKHEFGNPPSHLTHTHARAWDESSGSLVVDGGAGEGLV